MTDTRIVYGVRCVWWDSIDKAGRLPGVGLPCCPHCGSVLFEMESEELWWDSAHIYAAGNDPGHVAFLEWLRGKCFSNVTEAREVYDNAS